MSSGDWATVAGAHKTGKATTLNGTSPENPVLVDEVRAEFAVIGRGYTGLTLAEAGVDIVLLDANTLGWGPSGRAGGLVSTPSAKIDNTDIILKNGSAGAE